MSIALNPIAFHLGPILVHWYGIIIASAVLVAVYLSVKEGQQLGVKPDNFYDLVLYSLPVAIISARIYYVVFQWNYYQNHLDQIIKIWDGGIAIYGALIGAAVVVYFYCRRHVIPISLVLDIMAPTIIMGQGIGRWGNFMNQEAFGQITTLAFLQHLPAFIVNQMFIGGFYRQPTFLYESLWDLLGFALLLSLRHVPHLFHQGEIFFTYIIWYSFGRFFVEGMRTDSLMLGNVRISQLLSILLFVGAISLIIYRRRHGYNRWYLDGILPKNQ